MIDGMKVLTKKSNDVHKTNHKKTNKKNQKKSEKNNMDDKAVLNL